MAIYELLKIAIEKGKYDKDDLLKKLDTFLAFDRITREQYKELFDLIKTE